MAGGKKKKSSSNAKKNKSRRNRDGAGNGTNNEGQNGPIPLEDVLTQAESAMEMSDLDTALQLFSYASGVLRTRIRVPSTATSDGAGDGTNIAHDNDRDKTTLSAVLGKMGEIKASNGDVEGARSDFLDAIELLDPNSQTALSMGNIGGDKMAVDEGSCTLDVAQSCERIAGLYLYLGQLCSGMEALKSFRTGVCELERAARILKGISAASSADGANILAVVGSDELDTVCVGRYLVETRRQLCAAYCSIAELYLTDLCDEPDAESSCEAVLTSALAIDDASSSDYHCEGGNSADGHIGPPLPDALQTMANFRLSQSRVPEALECILKAYDRMKVGCEAMSALVGLANTDTEQLEEKSCEFVDVEAASSLPEYHFRCQTAKIMLECASLIKNFDSYSLETSNQCVESAIQVLGSLLAEDDEVIEVWYLLGCAFMACTPSNLDSANHYLETALSMLTKVKQDLENSIGDSDDDENELEAIECQIIEVKKKLGTYNEDTMDD